MNGEEGEGHRGRGHGWNWLAVVQGAYYLITAAWAIVHRSSFEAVTGPKTDYWLVITVSLQICAIALALLASAARPIPSGPVVVLGISSALGFLIVDLVYPLQGRIAKTYLLDAGPQAVFIVAWARLWLRNGRA